MSSKLARAFRRILHLVARPAKRDWGREGAVIQPYRGYGTRDEVYLMGRVFRQPRFGSGIPPGTLARDLVDALRRLLRWGLGGATVAARLAGETREVTTDPNGYFNVKMHPAQPLAPDRLWHPVDLRLVTPADATAPAEGHVFVPPPSTRFVVISDIDDTVMFTGVANKLKMLWRLFVQDAESRVAFPGVAALYRALHRGATGQDKNPMLYVSRGPWSIYEVLEAFFDHHRIPVGPVLFLREWGLSLQHPLPRRAKGHKRDLIHDMLARYADLPFVLIGDSGQRDPEIYAEIVRTHPGRVQAVYIRNVSRDTEREAAIEALAREVAEAGSSLLLAADSFAMAEHAAEHGLIAPEALPEVLRERAVQEEGRATPQPMHAVERPTRQGTRQAVERGAVRTALDEPTGEAPPNVVVEAEEAETDRPERS